MVGDIHKGIYTVVASNNFGAATRSDVEVLVYPINPTVRLTVNSNVVNEGEDITLECHIRGLFPWATPISYG